MVCEKFVVVDAGKLCQKLVKRVEINETVLAEQELLIYTKNKQKISNFRFVYSTFQKTLQ